MADIPLHPLSSSRGGYSAVQIFDADESDMHIDTDDHDDHDDLPQSMRAGPSSPSRRTPFTVPGRRRRYTDDPEEAQNLLGDHTQDDSALEAELETLEELDTSHKAVNLSKKLLHGKKSKEKDKSRIIPFRPPAKMRRKFPSNAVRNQKYNIITFLPIVLYEQFKFFFNLYFLLVALSQFIPTLKIGFLTTYVAPLIFVLLVTMSKEAADDYQRNQRDSEANSAKYLILEPSASGDGGPHTRAVRSSKLKVGDLVHLEKNQRVPADIVLLRTSEGDGTCFIRTDQLDGETDWKPRIAVSSCQKLGADADLLSLEAEIYADAPHKDIHSFVGTFTIKGTQDLLSNDDTAQGPRVEPLTADNLLWANTVLAAGSAIGFVIYTGRDTRAVMNTSHPKTKVGLLDIEINRLAKILCAVTLALSVALYAASGFKGLWYIIVFRFLILFSSIIPISLRVNLDMGKTVYAHLIQTDKEIPNTIVRTSTLPEELGRVEYLLSDKTGTLTQNEMEMRKLHLGSVVYGHDYLDEIAYQLTLGLGIKSDQMHSSFVTGEELANRGRQDMSNKVKNIVIALALCHNVTPVTNEDGSVSYQASSPDEVAIVQFTEALGLTLVFRDRSRIELQTPIGNRMTFEILDIFPFTSESKRMSIIVRDTSTGEITFYQKGADTVMSRIVEKNDWLQDESDNMATEGLRTLVMGRKILADEDYANFKELYHEASIKLENRNESMASVISQTLERNLELLGLTGVEDKLQEGVTTTLELLREAGIKIWMLTGDKIETATCIARSTKLVSRNQFICQVAKLTTSEEAKSKLEFLQSRPDCCLVIDGESLQLCLNLYKDEFIEVATKLSAVVACRCSPTQKADVARLIRHYTKKRVCCIGDGGNDVSMIQASDVGVGIVGKEGKQASLAAEFSVTQFSYLTKLLLWHGRNSYKRSAKLSQFVIHRGLIISIMQAVFSSIFYFAPIALYQGWLMVGYATVYTMAPVFSLVIDRDVKEEVALLYPHLYKELVKGRSLSYKTFFTWLMISVYQGGAIMIMSLLLFENEFLNIVSISFTALVLNELIMVAVEITMWHKYMVFSEILTLIIYGVSIIFLPEYFNLEFVTSVRFIWKVSLIVAVSSVPLYLFKVIKNCIAPPVTSKLL